MYKYTLSDLKYKAEKLSYQVSAPHAIILSGSLGSGKTTFAQYFLKPILINPNQSITSPTFNIINVYDTTKGVVWHADLYRLKNEVEVFELGLIEFAHNGIVLIEWADCILPYLNNISQTVIRL